MAFIRKHWLFILIAIAVLIIAIAFLKPNNSAELRRQFKHEREQIIADLERSKAREKLLRADSIAIRKRMKTRQDSVDSLLVVMDRRIDKYIKEYEQIDFSKFTDRELDSVGAEILRRYHNK